jgi:NADH dehydrogenase FAD-containing subunit
VSPLAPLAVTLASGRAALAAAVARLATVWRDQHFTAFQTATVTPVDVATRRLVAALETADRAVDAVFRELRGLGADP